jgi:ABC-type transporter Mla subunit MlaD
MNYLLQSWSILGINAPRFAWFAAFILLILALLSIFVLLFKVQRFSRSSGSLSSSLEKLSKPTIGNGLSLAQVEGMKEQFARFPLFARSWTRLRDKLVRRSGQEGDEFWLSSPASEVLQPSVVTDYYIDREWYSAIPGILTGTGLLVTFIAILVALLHVRINGTRVEGMDLLIEGLSGKFVSSIAALMAATIFVVFERTQMHKLDRSVHQLSAAVDGVIPVLAPIHLLIELQKDIGEQSVAFRSFNADLSGRLKQSFSESMGPTLERMVTAVEDLNQLLRAAETAKSDTISESLSGMISRLESSLTESLGKMGEQFASKLSGDSMTQFSRVSDSIAGAASVFEKMTRHNQETQAVLSEIVALAKSSATEQMALGRSQIEDLTNVLRSMLTQIEQATGSSVNNMGAALSVMMADLSSKVAELTEQSRSSMVQTSQASAEAAKSVIKEASDWSIASKEQLASLIEKHTSQLMTVEKLTSSLEEAASRFSLASSEFNSIITKLQHVSTDAGVCMTAMSGAAKSVKDSQEGLQIVADESLSQVVNLSQVGREQQEFVSKILQTMQQYQETFAKVESSASSLLQMLDRNLNQHLELCKKGYDSLIEVSNNHFVNATERLGSTVDELQEYLSDLNELLATKSPARNAHGG